MQSNTIKKYEIKQNTIIIIQQTLPRIKELRPNLLMKMLSTYSPPVNNSATTYKLGRIALALSIIYCAT